MGKYRTPFANNDAIHLIDRNKEPEQKLWISVLAKAFEDAFKSTDTRAALEALSWIRHGSDFNQVCNFAGRDGTYVKAKMLDKVISREENILNEHIRIKQATNKLLKLKNKNMQEEILKPKKKKRKSWGNISDYKWLPKYGHDYIER